MDRGPWRATVHRVAKSRDMIKQENNNQPQGKTLHQKKDYNLLKAQMIASIFFLVIQNFKIKVSTLFIFRYNATVYLTYNIV